MGLRELVAENQRSAAIAGGLLVLVAAAFIVYQVTLPANGPGHVHPPGEEEHADDHPDLLPLGNPDLSAPATPSEPLSTRIGSPAATAPTSAPTPKTLPVP